MSRIATRVRSDERGFTLVELLTAITIGLIIMFAALSAFDVFNHGIDRNNRVTDAEDSGRRDVGTMVRMIRDAGAPAPVTGAVPATILLLGPNDIVFKSTSWPGESGTGVTTPYYERICLDTIAKTVWFDGLRTGTPDLSNLPPCGTAPGWVHLPLSHNVANTTALPLFHYGTTPVRSIGITLRTQYGTTTSSDDLPLSSGSTMRGALPPAVTSGGVTYTCNSDGSGKALLSLGANTNLNLAVTGGISIGPGQVLVNVAHNVTTQLALTVTNPLGLQTLLFKDVTCP